MKGHKGHHHREERKAGGKAESPIVGTRVDDDETNPIAYAGAHSNVRKEAEERKAGGRTKKKIGGALGEKGEHRADRKPRRHGGPAGADKNPLSSAHAGTRGKKHENTQMNYLKAGQ